MCEWLVFKRFIIQSQDFSLIEIFRTAFEMLTNSTNSYSKNNQEVKKYELVSGCI